MLKTFLFFLVIFPLFYAQYVPDKKDQKCMHKKETRFNQKIPIESPVLRGVLRKYEEMHKQATNNENIVEAFHEGNIKNKYLYIEEGTSGLGNRLISILSAFLFALLTNRVILIKSMDYDFNLILCQPFHNSSWIMPEGVDMKKVKGQNIVGDHASGHYGRMLNPKIEDELKNVPIYRIRDSEQYFMPYIFANPAFKERLHAWFPSRNVGTVLAKYLLHPRDDIWMEVLETFQSKPLMSHSLGMQVRSQSDGKQQLGCFGDIPNDAYIYVASLMRLKESIMMTRSNNWVITQKYSEGGQVNDYNQVKHALYDIFLLSLTDRCAISAHSTFGYLVMALKGSMCVFSKDRADEKDPPCYLPNSHEICFHLGYRNDISKEVQKEMFTQGCRDFYQSQGLQINYGRHLTITNGTQNIFTNQL